MIQLPDILSMSLTRCLGQVGSTNATSPMRTDMFLWIRIQHIRYTLRFVEHLALAHALQQASYRCGSRVQWYLASAANAGNYMPCGIIPGTCAPAEHCDRSEEARSGLAEGSTI